MKQYDESFFRGFRQGEWKQFSDHHFRCEHAETTIDYWPSTGRFWIRSKDRQEEIRGNSRDVAAIFAQAERIRNDGAVEDSFIDWGLDQ